MVLDPTNSDAQAAQWCTSEINPADDKPYLVLHYRRRIGLADWTIKVESSSDVAQWSSAADTTEQSQPPTPLSDGITEIVHARVLKPKGMDGTPEAFVRLSLRPL